MVPDGLSLSAVAHLACLCLYVAKSANLSGDGSLEEECEEEPTGDDKRQIVDPSDELPWASDLLAKSSSSLKSKTQKL
jgi:V8-like Glu-specific endopeptidase